MPAPSAQSIETYLTKALLAKGFNKKSFVNGALVVEPTTLPPELKKLVQGVSAGLNEQWIAWQATQTVTVPGVTSGPSVATGILP